MESILIFLSSYSVFVISWKVQSVTGFLKELERKLLIDFRAKVVLGILLVTVVTL